ncbi:hypothetical protein [Roseomonas xinghualingensis]|uniref:hypothetical protein n=1 Tax=Roseomonas xinghualingensis TaxID=2986475 RepID=UPI0021F14E1F|nr:hypothetical protein [Roseomonas sp. SXEYE001]MCV4209880.1 hypothetical protein [Roseomonas sp. SXEYE001]
MADLSPEQWGRKAADLEILDFIRARITSFDADARVQKTLGKEPSPTDAAFLAAKRERFDAARIVLERRA